MTTIDMHRSPQRRARPMDMGPSQRTAEVVLGPRLEEYHFVQPARDDSMLDLAGDPADVASARESIRLAFVYVAAFEAYDIPAVVTLMREDAVLSMPPWDTWLQGRDDVGDWMLGPGIGCKGSRLIPVDVNGTAGFASYKPTPSERLEPWAIQVIEVAGGRIVGHHNFIGAELFAAFGLPPHLDA